MLESRIARGLMLLGAGIGVVSVVVAALDMQMNLPDWLIRVAMIKLAFVASAGLLVAGAMVGRHARSRSLPTSAPNLLPQQRAESFGQTPKTLTPDEVQRVVGRAQRGTDERGH